MLRFKFVFRQNVKIIEFFSPNYWRFKYDVQESVTCHKIYRPINIVLLTYTNVTVFSFKLAFYTYFTNQNNIRLWLFCLTIFSCSKKLIDLKNTIDSSVIKQPI